MTCDKGIIEIFYQNRHFLKGFGSLRTRVQTLVVWEAIRKKKW
jgi:hypothetical protein